MKRMIYPTPDGTEVVYETAILVRIELLKARLKPIAESFSALPITAHLAERLLPTAKAAWDTWAPNGIAYLELTPESLTGFGRSVSLGEIPDKPLLSTPLECWGLAVAVAERLAEACGARVCPLYLENALGMAAGDLRVTVELTKGTAA